MLFVVNFYKNIYYINKNFSQQKYFAFFSGKFFGYYSYKVNLFEVFLNQS